MLVQLQNPQSLPSGQNNHESRYSAIDVESAPLQRQPDNTILGFLKSLRAQPPLQDGKAQAVPVPRDSEPTRLNIGAPLVEDLFDKMAALRNTEANAADELEQLHDRYAATWVPEPVTVMQGKTRGSLILVGVADAAQLSARCLSGQSMPWLRDFLRERDFAGYFVYHVPLDLLSLPQHADEVVAPSTHVLAMAGRLRAARAEMRASMTQAEAAIQSGARAAIACDDLDAPIRKRLEGVKLTICAVHSLPRLTVRCHAREALHDLEASRVGIPVKRADDWPEGHYYEVRAARLMALPRALSDEHPVDRKGERSVAAWIPRLTPLADRVSASILDGLVPTIRDAQQKASAFLVTLNDSKAPWQERVLATLIVAGKDKSRHVMLVDVGNPSLCTVVVRDEASGRPQEHEVSLAHIDKLKEGKFSSVTSMAYDLRTTYSEVADFMGRYDEVVMREPVAVRVDRFEQACDVLDMRLVRVCDPKVRTVLCTTSGSMGRDFLAPVRPPQGLPPGHYYEIPLDILRRREPKS